MLQPIQVSYSIKDFPALSATKNRITSSLPYLLEWKSNSLQLAHSDIEKRLFFLFYQTNSLLFEYYPVLNAGLFRSFHLQSVPTALLEDRKSTRLNSSHVSISYAVFCLIEKKIV